MKKALQLASVASMIDQFNIPNIELLQSLGYCVDVVADFTNPGNISKERAKELIKRLEDMDVRVIDIAVPRSLNPKAIIRAYKSVKKLITTEHYNLVHCHSPIGGAITRFAAKSERKLGTRVLYTAHGFHFYDGAPIKNWLIFYPIENWLSKYTDVLITINKEDYKRAENKFRAKKVVYVPGIGVDTAKFSRGQSGREKVRTELGLNDSDIMFLSVGELNENKNHISVIRALKGIENCVYVIVGKGNKKEELKAAAEENHVNLRLMGFRTDVADFYKASDVYILPSIREGLNVSLMEAMASGLPIVCGDIRGNKDLIDTEGGYLFDPSSVESIRMAIENILVDRDQKGIYNRVKIKDYSIDIVKDKMRVIYNQM